MPRLSRSRALVAGTVFTALLTIAACASSGAPALLPAGGSSSGNSSATFPSSSASFSVSSKPAGHSAGDTGSTAAAGGTVTTEQVENALKKNAEISTIKGEVTSEQYDEVVSCLAKVLEKHADSSDLKAFVDGRKTLDDVQGSDATAAASEAEQCVETTVGGV